MNSLKTKPKPKIRGFSSMVVICTIGLVLTTATIILYKYYFLKLPPSMTTSKLKSPVAISTKFINDHDILLDIRVGEKHGSWSSNYILNDPATIELVYAELEKRLKSKKQVLLIDIGANTGSFALLPILTNKIKVVAFEPNLEVADILRANVILNNIANNVTIMPIGVSDQNAILQLHIPLGNPTGLATFGQNVLRFDANAGYTYSALVKPLDELVSIMLKKGEKIDFIKIDTEGWEYYVLLGARKTLQEHRPTLLLEFYPQNMQQAGVDSKKLEKLLEELNYSCSLLVEDLFCKPL